jgi:hypothetical protein
MHGGENLAAVGSYRLLLDGLPESLGFGDAERL